MSKIHRNLIMKVIAKLSRFEMNFSVDIFRPKCRVVYLFIPRWKCSKVRLCKNSHFEHCAISNDQLISILEILVCENPKRRNTAQYLKFKNITRTIEDYPNSVVTPKNCTFRTRNADARLKLRQFWI